MPPSVCLVGAGAAGLAAAHALARAGASVTVVEKSRGLGGRLATRWFDRPDGRGGSVRWRADHGAQVLAPEPGSPADALVRAAPGVAELPGVVWPVDDRGALRPDDARADGPPRLALADGAAALGRALADATPGLVLHGQTTATALERDARGWTLHATDAEGRDVALGPFAAVVLTPPGPQAAALLDASTFDDDARTSAADALRASTYRAQFAVMAGFAGADVGRPAAGVQALVHVGTPGAQAVAWLAWESDKPGRAPAGHTLLVAQMSDAWTRAHYDDPKPDVAAAALREAEALVGSLPAPLFADTQRWRYSLPDAPADRAALAGAEALGLFVAGDALVGRGRVHLALADGLAAAARARAYITARD